MFLWENCKVNNFCGASVNLLIQGDSVAAPFLLLRNPEKDRISISLWGSVPMTIKFIKKGKDENGLWRSF